MGVVVINIPTPVSALIHAATMVTAGVFLLIRASPLFDVVPLMLIIIMTIGVLTVFFAGTIGLVQNDLKKIIAYSTCSQLGYMVVACGLSHFSIGLFHLMNHAFFKALLFLSAGSLIHAVVDEQDVRKMGGLSSFLPLTYLFFIIGSFSLMGFPFLTGFYSKDLILEFAFGQFYLIFVYLLGCFSVLLTAIYSIRLIFLSFLSNTNLKRGVFFFLKEGE
jgi:NADH-ubiquinone oxidoreductase chain 5